MVDIPLLHLGLHIPHPELHIRRLAIQRAFEDAPRPTVLFLLELPAGVAEPVAHVEPVAADIVFEFLALAALEFVEFFEVGEALGGGCEGGFLAVDGFAEELFGGDLLGGGGFVLDPRRAAGGLHGGW